MTDDLRLLDDPHDEATRDFLAGLDRGPAMTVDVDVVVVVGARRRRLLLAERVLGVAATLAVVAGVAVFAVGRSGSGNPGPAGPSPSIRSQAPSASDWAWYELGDPGTRTGMAVASVQNTSTEPITVLAPKVEGADGVRAVLTQMIPAEPSATVIGLAYLKKVDRPAPASVLLLPGRSLLVVMAVPATCGSADRTASTVVTLPLRSASGLTGSLELGTKLPPTQSWERTARTYACGSH